MSAKDTCKAHAVMPRMPRVPPRENNGGFQRVAMVFSMLFVNTFRRLHVLHAPRGPLLLVLAPELGAQFIWQVDVLQ